MQHPTAADVIKEAGGRPEFALSWLDADPTLRLDPWVALSLGDASLVDDAVNPGGPLDLPPLFYVARSRIADASAAAAAAHALLARGADPNGQAAEQWTTLSFVCSRGNGALARVLLEGGAEPNDNDSLYHSVEPAEDLCTRLLLEHGAAVNGTVALHHALDYDRIDRVRLLLEHGADPNEASDWPALHHAVSRGRSAEYLRLLLDHGADPTARDSNGRTAFQHAFRRAADEPLKILRDAGSPEDITDEDLALNAVATGSPLSLPELDDDARDVLIELAMRDIDGLGRVIEAAGHGFSARWGGGPRGTLLHHASWIGKTDYVELLLGAGAAVDERVETEYATPLGWAAVGSRYSPEHPHSNFSSPAADYVGVAKLLVRAGARVEPKFTEMAAEPLAGWLAESG